MPQRSFSSTSPFCLIPHPIRGPLYSSLGFQDQHPWKGREGREAELGQVRSLGALQTQWRPTQLHKGSSAAGKAIQGVPSQVSGKICAFVPLHRAVIPKEGWQPGTSPAASGGGSAGPPTSTMVLSTTNSPPPPGLSQLSTITSYACWVNTQLRNSIACEHILYLKAYRHALAVLPYHGQAGGASGKEPACKCGLDPSVRNPLEEGMATHFSILAWRIPRTEEPGRLQLMRSHGIRYTWAT